MSTDHAVPRSVAPAEGALMGPLRMPGDKSIGHRSLMFGALARGEVSVRGLSDGADVASTRKVLTGLGARFEDQGDAVFVADAPLRSATAPLDCGNSGTTMRLMMGILVGQKLRATLVGDASLSKRPMARVSDPLAELGADIELSPEGTAPVDVRVAEALHGVDHTLRMGSAQVKSAVLLAALGASGPSVVRDPFGSRDHTENLLHWLGGDALIQRRGAEIRLNPGPLTLPADASIDVPGDPSSAAFWAVAAAIVPGSDVEIHGVLLNPTRIGWLAVLKEMGADIEVVPGQAQAGEPTGTLRVRGSALRGVTVPSERVPSLVDEVPVLSVAAAVAAGTSRFEGLAELRHKESDRLARVHEGLVTLGANASVEGDDLVLTGEAKLHGGAIETEGDHRIAMAFAVAALVANGEVELSDASCVGISYPSFFDHLDSLRGDPSAS